MVLRSSIKLIFKSLAATLFVTAIMATVALTWLRLTGNQVLAVQTDSMVPTFKPGDALIVHKSGIKALKPGQIVTYKSTRDPNIVISHRLIKIDKKTGWVITAGDAIHANDPSFPPKLVVGQVVYLLPDYGRALAFMRSWKGLALTIYLPAGLAVVYEFKQLSRVYATPFYNARL